jgi:hypothetical protein
MLPGTHYSTIDDTISVQCHHTLIIKSPYPATLLYHHPGSFFWSMWKWTTDILGITYKSYPNSSFSLLLTARLKIWRNYTVALSHVQSNSQFAHHFHRFSMINLHPSPVVSIDSHHHEPVTRQYSSPPHLVDRMSNHQHHGPSPCSPIVPPSMQGSERTPA